MALSKQRLRRRLLAGRESWRRMEEGAIPLGPWGHVALCLATVVVACALLALASAHQPAVTLLHRWFPGVALLFAPLLFAFLTVLLRGWVGRSLLAVPVGALASYAAAPLAFHFYFALFETALWRKWLLSTDPWMAAVLTVAVWPSFLLAWLFGALAAALYLVGAVALETHGLALLKARGAVKKP